MLPLGNVYAVSCLQRKAAYTIHCSIYAHHLGSSEPRPFGYPVRAVEGAEDCKTVAFRFHIPAQNTEDGWLPSGLPVRHLLSRG